MIVDDIKVNNPDFFINKMNKTSMATNNAVLRNPFSEDFRHFAEYIERLGVKESNLLVLSSLHHYYYDAEEMKNVKAVVNLKELNHIKELKNFLHSIFHIMPAGCNFIGCFINSKKQSNFGLNKDPDSLYNKKRSDEIENGIYSNYPILNMVYNMIDSRTNKYLSEKSVSHIFVEHGFKIIDITEIEELTYFCAIRLKSVEK